MPGALTPCIAAARNASPAPPGLAPVSFSDRGAVAALQQRKSKVPNCTDPQHDHQILGGIQNACITGIVPINMLYALYQALFLVLEEGLEHVVNVIWTITAPYCRGLETLGLNMVVGTEILPGRRYVLFSKGKPRLFG